MATFSGKNYNSEERIYTLQRCVSKMEKLFNKSEKEYLKKIEKLKEEIDKKDRVAQVRPVHQMNPGNLINITNFIVKLTTSVLSVIICF